MPPDAEAVIDRLDAARQKWWLFTLLSSTVLAVCVSFGLFLLFMLGDAFLKLPQLALLTMFAVWLAVSAALVTVVSRRLLRRQRNLMATARRVESEHPELGSNLINLVQLAEDTRGEGGGFRLAAVDRAAAEIGRTRFDDAPGRLSRRRRFLHCMQTPRDLLETVAVLALLVVLAAFCRWQVPNLGSAATRLLMPWRFVPSVGVVEIVEVTPGDTDVLIGSSLEISAAINNPNGTPYKAVLFVGPEAEKETALPMAAGPRHRRYTLTLPSVVEPLSYRLEIGDSQSGIYRVSVRRKPAVEQMQITLHYPAYLNRDDEAFAQQHGDLEAPQYTQAELHIRPSVPIAKGHIQSGNRQYIGQTRQNGELLVVENMPLFESTTYTVHLFDDAGYTDPDPRINRVRVLPDRPPAVQLLKPPRHASAAPGDDVPVMIRAGDDHGLGRLALEMIIRRAGPQPGWPVEEVIDPHRGATPVVVRQWNDSHGGTTAVRRDDLRLGHQRVGAGQVVLLRAVASDRRVFRELGRDLDPQTTHSQWHAIRIVAKEQQQAAALAELGQLRAAVWKIFERQVRTRVHAAGILESKLQGLPADAVAELRGRQIGIQRATLDLVKTIGQTGRQERLVIKRVLNNLALGEMLRAVRQCDELLKLRTQDQLDRSAPQLLVTQDRIIEVLRKLLDIARRAQTDALAEMENRGGGDLPGEVREKFAELRDKLDEFLEQQKKVIEATRNLAKTPVDDFTEKQEQLLRELAVVEDDWARFLEDFHSDLSKLPEQDFSNPSLLKELIEIQTEIKMAEGALLEKTAEIAVPLEQLGAEMAEELVTNLEKWLPDSPDRERWSQEESLGDELKEAPMAELPGELEDLIGELMEEEEDLFDEMEDISSSAADSLDKGAGWDTADGPISNMSAKGATGNRLPNTSEIGGRAGEGRSGKSSGEFVGREAVGKDGRKTPSRLTPDPLTNGQIKDHSKDPAGGATGGGKESGQGGRGLEGPVPPSPGMRQLQRLAGRQAELRNRAEGIDLQFQVTDFHRTDLKETIALMARVERDLRAGRYRNALRQRNVLLNGLGNVKRYLAGEFEVRRDATANLPKEIQKELLGGMRDPSPTGWEGLNRQYFERLNSAAQ